jgi:hypothetical protein
MEDKESKKANNEVEISGKKSTNKKGKFNIDDILQKLLSSRK